MILGNHFTAMGDCILFGHRLKETPGRVKSGIIPLMNDFPPPLLHYFQTAQQVVVLTGAGISAESGIPTFRQAQTGLWSRYNPEELATRLAFQRNPRLVWEWYSWRRELIERAKPNPAHFALVALAGRIPRLTLITQNVDGFHQLAGSQGVIELHGNIWRNKCFEEEIVITEWPETEDVPPHCPRCGGLLRPDVVWFGESLPRPALAAATQAANQCDLFLIIGTSSLVYPAAGLPLIAKARGTPLIEINPEKTPLTPEVDYALHGPAGIILPNLLQQLNQYAQKFQEIV